MLTQQTVEERITKEYNCEVSELLQNYANEGKTSKEVAVILDCGVSNVRRIARKYGVSFNQQQPQTRINNDEAFNSDCLNGTNFLSRRWVVSSKTAKQEVREAETA